MTEIEDELYKRIQQAFNEPVPDDLGGQVAIDRITKLAEIKTILDKAKADFPDENDEKYKDRDIPMFPSQRSGNYYRFRYDQYINDVQQWFKEHFGSRISKLSSAATPQQP